MGHEAGLIPFADYQRDMNELGDLGSSIVRRQKQRIDELTRIVGILIAGAGGKIAVQDHLLAGADMLILTVDRDESRGETTYSVGRP